MAKKELKLRAMVAPTETVIVSAYDEESILNENGRILLDRLNPLIYDEEQGRYLSVGEPIAEAFRTGIALKKSMPGD